MTTAPPIIVQLHAADCAALGIDPTDTAVTLPGHWSAMSRTERVTWTRGQIEGIALEFFAEIAADALDSPVRTHPPRRRKEIRI